MQIDNLIMIPEKITPGMDLTNGFKLLLGSETAKKHKGIVYFIFSEKSIPRTKGFSNILYIGKTNQNLYQRYFRYAVNLASNQSGCFYQHILDNYGSITIGFVLAEDPKLSESNYFQMYYENHLEYPPKSKAG